MALSCSYIILDEEKIPSPLVEFSLSNWTVYPNG
jgi:hypothetical protein